MKTACIQSIADQYKINYCLARTIMLGMTVIEKKTNRCYYNHADACKRVDAYLLKMTEPDASQFCYQKTMNRVFKAANETVCLWIKHKDFPKPVNTFIGKNYKAAPYWRIEDVQAFLNDHRTPVGHKVKRTNPADAIAADMIDSKAANEFLKLPAGYLLKSWKQIPGLPNPHLHKRNFYWKQSELADWVNTLGDNTPHEVFLDYSRRERNNEQTNPFDQAARLFLIGHYSTPEQKQAQQRRREHASRIKPKTLIVQVASQW